MTIDAPDLQHFSSEEILLEALSKRQLVIPAYQRPYRWTQDQIYMLVRDLLDFYSSNNEKYSLGTIVCDRTRDGRYAVLDGQQRLVTMDIIFDVLGEALGPQPKIVQEFQYISSSSKLNPDWQPFSKKQRNAAAEKLRDHFEKDLTSLDIRDRLCRFRDKIRDHVFVRFVVIPLAGNVRYEAAQMFEIVNMRGQRLTELDILKARLISILGNDLSARRTFEYLWDTCGNRLKVQNQALRGLYFPDGELKKLSIDSFSAQAQTLEQILSFSPSATEPKDAAQRTADDQSSEENRTHTPPANFACLLVVADEILKKIVLVKHPDLKAEARAKLMPEALVTKRMVERFDWLFNEDTVKNCERVANVWRFMAILDLTLRAASHWGPYRPKETQGPAVEKEFYQNLTALHLLVLSFMAANGYQNDAQYWLLILTSDVVNKVLTSGRLPESAEEFVAWRRKITFPDDDIFRSNAFRHLVAWGYASAFSNQGAANYTQQVFSLLEQLPDSVDGLLSCGSDASIDLEERTRYDKGLKQWMLYLVDFMLLPEFPENPDS